MDEQKFKALMHVSQHGKRADGIVKSMMLHSRQGSMQKEPTDINNLADEYLRLSYHGHRAKDKAFNAVLKTDFGKNLENVNIVPQDIGRVLLNIYNNVFYAVSEKKRNTRDEYEAAIEVSTRKINGQPELTIRDNGGGIPSKLKDKIFQPFFTTKPNGQGTGLGLSMSYDIIKMPNGELDVKTEEGVGTEFIIRLPVN